MTFCQYNCLVTDNISLYTGTDRRIVIFGTVRQVQLTCQGPVNTVVWCELAARCMCKNTTKNTTPKIQPADNIDTITITITMHGDDHEHNVGERMKNITHRNVVNVQLTEDVYIGIQTDCFVVTITASVITGYFGSKFKLLKLNSSHCNTMPHAPNLPFSISDIRALWRSALSAKVPECQKLKMVS